MSQETKDYRKVRGDHCLNIFVSHELKSQLKELAQKYDRLPQSKGRSLPEHLRIP